MNILEDLYYGNISPNEKCFKHQPNYVKFAEIVAGNEEKLSDFLSNLPNAEQQRHQFEQMINAQIEISGFLELERFIEGFRLGSVLMLETFILPKQSIIKDIE